MWVIFDKATGDKVADMLADEPTPGVGQAKAEMPPSAIAGLTVWSAAERGYIDPPIIDLAGYFLLWTKAEAVAAYKSTDDGMIWFRSYALANPKINLAHQEVKDGLALAVSLNILTSARAVMIAAGQPPA